jgi:hypothetical protein
VAEFGVRFRLVKDEVGPLFQEISERAGEARPALVQMGAFLKKGAQQDFKDKAPPKSAASLEKEATTGTASVTAHGKVRASYAHQLDATLRRKGSEDAREELRRVLSGDLSGRATNKTVDRLRRRLQAAQAARDIGAKVAIGKRRSEKNAPRGGKMAGAFKVIVGRLSVKVQNSARYSAVHDEGGNVGNGARLPPWRFMSISEAGAERLADIALAWILEGRR